MKALSIQGPWWAYILMGIKPVENRSWTTMYRGPLLIQAAQKIAEADRVEAQQMAKRAGWTGGTPDSAELRAACGHIVGMVHLVDVVERHSSPFFTGRYGLVLARPQVFKTPVRCRGELNLFEVPDSLLPAGIVAPPVGTVQRLDFSANEIRDGVPCAHAGCLHHLSHPCDGCGRIGGKSPSAPAQRTFMGVDIASGDDFTALAPLPSDPLQRRMF